MQNDGDHGQIARLVSKWKINRSYEFRQLSFILNVKAGRWNHIG